MFIKKSPTKINGKTYKNYLLVQSVRTPDGPRHKVICSLGRLKPRPAKEWLKLAHKVEDALIGQMSLITEEQDKEIANILEKIKKRKAKERQILADALPQKVEVYPDKVTTTKSRELGTVLVGSFIWDKLRMDEALKRIGFSKNAIALTQVMVLNRLIDPRSENAMPQWAKTTAIEDILGIDVENLTEDALYRNLDRLHDSRQEIERHLVAVEEEIFGIRNEVLFYDLTSSYFEGLVLLNPKAKRGYSRDKRSDCKQVVVGLVVGLKGFPLAHEVFEGNRVDATTLDEMLTVLKKRTDVAGDTIVIDKGLASTANLELIKARGMHYVVAGRGKDVDEWLEAIMSDGWQEIKLTGRVAGKRQSFVRVKGYKKGEQMAVLCLSEGRREKERAIRERQEKGITEALTKLEERIEKGSLKDEKKIHQAIGRLKERYPRVGRYFQIETKSEGKGIKLHWRKNQEVLEKIAQLDGAYILLTDRMDMGAEEIFKTYNLLTRAEAAFEDMKSPLSLRPIYHHLEHRTEAHIFLCILAYHLLVAIETILAGVEDNRSWKTIRSILRSHQITTIVLPTADGNELRIRKPAIPEPVHREIYRRIGMIGDKYVKASL